MTKRWLLGLAVALAALTVPLSVSLTAGTLELERVREISPARILRALDFLGYTHSTGCTADSRDLCTKKAAALYQQANGEPATGTLTPEQTVRLIRTAAERGDPISQNALGEMYAKGIGVPIDLHQALLWFEKAAAQRNPDAMYNLSVLYRFGPDDVRDEHKAVLFQVQGMASGYVPPLSTEAAQADPCPIPAIPTSDDMRQWLRCRQQMKPKI